ncbi:monothiol glutaredoxin-S2-like [Telopea speciosissima]|uniref:monothiol glutaredoxin-S2-like n=1 Tax=Telopea speciosissima TaxID=54955 RepID=UPI001CC4DFEB|nr:monothiol glutaredoxin-S2-like [Telopea speciosissima]XP_043708520.1 monothiol glutaredoxin-S2-like [Telopea speciosissima]
MEKVSMLSKQKPVVIFSKSSCCMSHTLKTLICNYGANPLIYELDEDPKGRELENSLMRLGCNPVVPVVFIGGQLIGGANEVMERQMNGTLKNMLIQANAIWV